MMSNEPWEHFQNKGTHEKGMKHKHNSKFITYKITYHNHYLKNRRETETTNKSDFTNQNREQNITPKEQIARIDSL